VPAVDYSALLDESKKESESLQERLSEMGTQRLRGVYLQWIWLTLLLRCYSVEISMQLRIDTQTQTIEALEKRKKSLMSQLAEAQSTLSQAKELAA